MPPSDELFSRDEALAGLPAQRARTLLFLIESRTAHWVARSRRAMERFPSEQAAEERDLAFLEAFALGRDPPLKPSIQDLERFAGQWKSLVPDTPRLRAALARLLAEKYSFSYYAVPGIRVALGLDREPVKQAYQRLYRQSLETLYTARPGLLERLRWAWNALGAWVDNLPPFWTAFSITLTETVGASILALPIALAGIGPLPGLVFLVLLGLVNVLTICCIAETLTRTGSIRFGNAFFGRLVSEYLGSSGSALFSASLIFLNILVLIAYYIGIGKTMEGATHVPAVVWVAAVYLIGIFMISRESINATMTFSLVVGVVNILMILVLAGLALPHLNLAYLSYVNLPLLNGRPFDPSILQLVFGIILAAYFGHTSIANSAKVVLLRDASGRSLIWGSMAALFVAIFLNSIWVLAVNGSISPTVLAGEAGTALTPLSAQVGPVVNVFGTIFVILGLGMASIHFSLGSYNMLRERLPTSRRPVLILPRRQAVLIFQPKGKRKDKLRVGLVYLGLSGGAPLYRLDLQDGAAIHRLEAATAGQWNAGALLKQRLRGDVPEIQIQVNTLDATQESARLQVITPMSITYQGEWDTAGLELAALLDLPEDRRQILSWILRQGEASLDQIAAYLKKDPQAIQPVLVDLERQGYLYTRQNSYRARLAPKRGHGLPQSIWDALDGPIPGQAQPPALSQKPYLNLNRLLQTLSDNHRLRFLLGITPLTLIFFTVEWLILIHAESFVGPLNFVGTIIVSLLAGTFPVLLLASSRRRGELLPGKTYTFLGNPLLLALIYLLNLGSIFLHGLLIWHNPVQQGIAIVTGLSMLAATVWMVRQGSFKPRLNVELRSDQNERRGAFSITEGGKPLEASVDLTRRNGVLSTWAASGEVDEFPNLCSAGFRVTAQSASELKIWVHEISSEESSCTLPATAEILSGGESQTVDLQLRDGQAVITLKNKSIHIEIHLAESKVE